jgi:hypothetical protein
VSNGIFVNYTLQDNACSDDPIFWSHHGRQLALDAGCWTTLHPEFQVNVNANGTGRGINNKLKGPAAQ